jgi:hypothetical protein
VTYLASLGTCKVVDRTLALPHVLLEYHRTPTHLFLWAPCARK